LAEEESTLDTTEFQAALARLLVDPAALQRFAADAEGAGRELGLSAEQVDALKFAGIDRLRYFAHELAEKRLVMSSKLCAGTFELLRRHDLLRVVAPRFAREHLPRESPEHATRTVRDFFWLAETLERMMASGELSCPWLEDVLRCELLQARLSTSLDLARSSTEHQELHDAWPSPRPDELLALRPRRGDHAVVATFSCDVVTLLKELSQHAERIETEAQPTTLLLVKRGGFRKVQIVRINDATRRLIELCDGTRTVREIVAQLSRAEATPEGSARRAEGSVKIIGEMYRLGAIRLEKEIS
jgi:hypothetical protein